MVDYMVTEDVPQYKAYQHFHANCKLETAEAKMCQLFKRPEVKEYFEKRQSEVSNKAKPKLIKTIEAMQDILTNLANNADKDSDKIRAAEVMLKSLGGLTDRLEAHLITETLEDAILRRRKQIEES